MSERCIPIYPLVVRLYLVMEPTDPLSVTLEEFEETVSLLFQHAYRTPQSESHSYAYIDYILSMYGTTVRGKGKNCRLALIDPFGSTKGSPDYSNFILYKRKAVLKNMWEGKPPLEGPLMFSDRAGKHHLGLFCSSFEQLNRYAILTFDKYRKQESLFLFFSSGNYFTLLEFPRSQYNIGRIYDDDYKKYLCKMQRARFNKIPDNTLRKDIFRELRELESTSLKLMVPEVHFFGENIIQLPDNHKASNAKYKHPKSTIPKGRAGSLTPEIRMALRRATEHDHLEIKTSFFDLPNPAPGTSNRPRIRSQPQVGQQNQGVENEYIMQARDYSLNKIRYSEFVPPRAAGRRQDRDATPTPVLGRHGIAAPLPLEANNRRDGPVTRSMKNTRRGICGILECMCMQILTT
ncbi:hypothetical protein ABKN59_009497 [Abortiporus biennis]